MLGWVQMVGGFLLGIALTCLSETAAAGLTAERVRADAKGAAFVELSPSSRNPLPTCRRVNFHF